MAASTPRARGWHYVKVLLPGARQWRFIAAGERTTRLRVHALTFPDAAAADLAVADLEAANPGLRAQRRSA